jgi:nucleotide-binding universal stress UspA family protein
MTWCSLLVVANVTADSDELTAALRRRAEDARVRVQLVVPIGGAGPDREQGERQLERGLDRMADAGVEAQGQVVRGDPVQAVHDVWDAAAFDEIVVSTLPTGISKWLRIDVPHRLEKLTGARVEHVETAPARPSPPVTHRERRRERSGLLAPLAALPWSSRHREH